MYGTHCLYALVRIAKIGLAIKHKKKKLWISGPQIVVGAHSFPFGDLLCLLRNHGHEAKEGIKLALSETYFLFRVSRVCFSSFREKREPCRRT
jgi:hypothetical protein